MSYSGLKGNYPGKAANAAALAARSSGGDGKFEPKQQNRASNVSASEKTLETR